MSAWREAFGCLLCTWPLMPEVFTSDLTEDREDMLLMFSDGTKLGEVS